jgi:hypothetical protein
VEAGDSGKEDDEENDKKNDKDSKKVQQFASKHKPQTFSRVCLRLKRGVLRNGANSF